MDGIGAVSAAQSALISFLLVGAFGMVVLVTGVLAASRRSLVLKVCGLLLVLLGAGLPLSCCLTPNTWFFVLTGGCVPLRKLPEDWTPIGKTHAEVRAKFGPPHSEWGPDGNDRWDYYRDPFSICYYSVSFGEDGRVKEAWGQ